ncbi:MAG: MoaD/ThiS family protein [Bacteroidetes bacterium]|nr:MoaD/ThiS family protein [Bacteroidota bacterium]
MAKILIPTPLRKFTENNATVEVTKNTIGDSIHELAEKHPGLKKHLIDEKGDIRSFIRIYLGDDDIKSLDGPSTRIEENSLISIIPAIAGGM